MPLPYEFNGACSIELFRPEDLGLEPQQAGCHSRDAALNILLPFRSGSYGVSGWFA